MGGKCSILVPVDIVHVFHEHLLSLLLSFVYHSFVFVAFGSFKSNNQMSCVLWCLSFWHEMVVAIWAKFISLIEVCINLLSENLLALLASEYHLCCFLEFMSSLS